MRLKRSKVATSLGRHLELTQMMFSPTIVFFKYCPQKKDLHPLSMATVVGFSSPILTLVPFKF